LIPPVFREGFFISQLIHSQQGFQRSTVINSSLQLNEGYKEHTVGNRFTVFGGHLGLSSLR
jgi:hypothetical protein